MAFGAAVKYNNTLLELNLEYNGLADDGTVALADALEQNASLRRLRAGHNNARIRGSFVMGLAVLHREAKLDFLGFGGNHPGVVGSRALLAAVRDRRGDLEVDMTGCSTHEEEDEDQVECGVA